MMYLIGSIGVAFLIGWIIGETKGKAKGYSLAMYSIQQQRVKEAMLQQFKRVMEEDDGHNQEG